MTGVFTSDVVDAIMRHMNVDHADDSLLICRALGARPGATRATMQGMDADGIDFLVEATDAPTPAAVRIPWDHRLSERGEVRVEVVRMYQEACAALGVEPRPD